MATRLTGTLEERFWRRVQRTDSCWWWTGAVCPISGYGKVSTTKGIVRGAHRVAWSLTHGVPVPSGLVVRHICDNRACVNPKHLLVGTQQENVRDMINRGRARPGRVVGEAHGKSKLTRSAVDSIRSRRAAGESMTAIAKSLGVHKATVRDVVIERTWKYRAEA